MWNYEVSIKVVDDTGYYDSINAENQIPKEASAKIHSDATIKDMLILFLNLMSTMSWVVDDIKPKIEEVL